MDNGAVTFSIIMPAYNSKAYVRDAVDSVLRQTYPHWELITVNDGSSDETLHILEQYAASDKRVKVFSKENGGYVSAVNFGLDNVSGDYVCFMGSDDRLSPDLFSRIVAYFSDSLPDMIGFKTVCCLGERTYVEASTRFDTVQTEFETDIKSFAEKYPAHSEIFFIRDTSKLFKTSLLGDLRYFGKYGMDADGIFSTLFSHKASSFASVPVDGYYWTLRKDSVSGRKTTVEVTKDRIQNWLLFFDALSAVSPDKVAPMEKEYLDSLVYLLKQYAIQAGSEEIVKQGLACVRQNYRRFSIKPNLRTRLFLRFPKPYLFCYRIFKRFAG